MQLGNVPGVMRAATNLLPLPPRCLGQAPARCLVLRGVPTAEALPYEGLTPLVPQLLHAFLNASLTSPVRLYVLKKAKSLGE